MHRKLHRKLSLLVVLAVLASIVMACTAPAAAPTGGAAAPAAGDQAAAPAGEKIKVGLSFSDFATERWKNEEVILRGLLEAKGYEVLSQEANQDVKLQNDQIDNLSLIHVWMGISDRSTSPSRRRASAARTKSVMSICAHQTSWASSNIRPLPSKAQRLSLIHI